MDALTYKNNELHIEQSSLEHIAAQYSTPTFIYSKAEISRAYQAYAQALGQHPGMICYAVKANSNLGVLSLLAQMGSGFDIVSVGELERVLKAGGDPKKVVFSGVGKKPEEIARALEVGVACFNVESESELETLADIAAAQETIAPISLRVNPDVDAQTHPYISTGLKENKFGIAFDRAKAVYARAAQMPQLKITGIDCHIGSQLTEVSPFLDALERVLALVDELAETGIQIEHLDLGGGLGVTYKDESPPPVETYVKAILDKLGNRKVSLVLEPGRSIVANAGILLTRVLYLKPTEMKNFAIVDAAMNDNIRPALYQAWQNVVPVRTTQTTETQNWDIVGPICETGDFLAKDRNLALTEGDLLAMQSCGAYGFTMSSNYNSRPRAAELIVDGALVHCVRKREDVEDLMSHEHPLPIT